MIKKEQVNNCNALLFTERQIWRKVKSVKEQGEIGKLNHKNQFHKPIYTILDETKNRIIEQNYLTTIVS